MSDALPVRPIADPPARKRRRPRPRLCCDAKRLAKLLGIGLRTIRTLDCGGRLPKPVLLGGRKLWYLPEVREWLRAGAPPREEWEVRKAARGGIRGSR